MLRLMGCLGRIFLLALLLGLMALAWVRGPDIWGRLRGGDEVAETEGGVALADESLAAAVVARYRQAIEDDSAQVSFSAQEIEAVLRHHLVNRIPKGGVEPTVKILSGEVHLAARFPRDSIPLPSHLEAGRALLPRRVSVELVGVVLSTESGPVLVVRRVHLLGLTVPRRISDSVVAHLRGGEGGTLPVSALPFELPPEARGAYIDGDRLVLGDLP